ncbi:MAG: hypothetical protein QOI38_2794 [Sphingomonadales bacterium]|nr:hypothetical protein [Sphingomonadales bacterium]
MRKGIGGPLTMLALSWAAPAGAEARPAGVPRIEGLAYPAARARLIRAGWRPFVAPGPRAAGALESGNGPYVRARGWREAEDCAGSGPAPCRFRFRGPRGRVIRVATLGEAPRLVVDNVSDAPR